MDAAEAARRVRLLCEAAISASWAAGQRDQAQAASDLLDEANGLLAELDGGAAQQAAPPPREPSPEPEPPAPQLPAETFFLPPDQVRECLTLNIDSSILLASQPAPRRGGWPAGRKRRADGGAAAGPVKRKGRRQYNPWTPELQQQLATVLRLALRCGGVAGVLPQWLAVPCIATRRIGQAPTPPAVPATPHAAAPCRPARCKTRWRRSRRWAAAALLAALHCCACCCPPWPAVRAHHCC